jgi:acetyl-CoA carboxylase biotin carboxyl carrier protein
MDLDQLNQILKLVRDHDLAEFEIEQEGLRLKVRRDGGVVAMVTPPVAAQSAAAPAAGVPAPVAPMTLPDSGEEVELAVVKSPIVGTFYRSPEPGAAPFVEVGTAIKKGQVLCVIEAMKLMNEARSFSPAARAGGVANYVQENSDREPRGSGTASHLRLPRARHQDRRGVFRG